MRPFRYGLAASLAIALGSGAASAAPAPAEPIADGAAGATVDALNRRIAERNAAILKGNADRQAAWEKERAEVAAENARAKAEFARQQAAHEADMARWRADTAALARAERPSVHPADAPPPKARDDRDAAGAPKRTCRMEAETGSRLRRTRVCLTEQERAQQTRDGQAMLRPSTIQCGPKGCT